MSTRYSFERDSQEALAMARGLAEYVRGDDLYGNQSGGMFGDPKMPKLTIGALLMRLRRLNILQDQMNEAQLAEYEKAQSLHDMVASEWRLHYEKKMIREAHSRIDAMRTFFFECEQEPNLCYDIYKPEVLRRTIVEEINTQRKNMDVEDDSLVKKIDMVDELLHGVVLPSEFIWSDVLQPAYPQEQFWWLYNAPPESDD